MNIDKIVEVNIQISEAMSIDGGYDTILIMGPLPKTPGGRVTPDVAGCSHDCGAEVVQRFHRKGGCDP